MSQDEIQSKLSELFCPPLDTTLVAAIAYEPGQTLQSAKEVCETLAAAAVPDHEDDVVQSSRTTSTVGSKTQNGSTRKSRSTGGGASARRKAFGGKLTNGEEAGTNDAATSDAPAGAKVKSTSSSGASSAAGGSSPVENKNAAADAATVERLLSEWSLVDKSSQDPENLHLTDEESTSDTESSLPGHSLLSSSTSTSSKLLDHEITEAERVGELSGTHTVDPSSLASGRTNLNKSSTNGRDIFDPIEFLKHAFPSRTVDFSEKHSTTPTETFKWQSIQS